MKRILTTLLTLLLILSLCGCNETGEKTYIVGICQLVTHDALDAATQGFKDVLTEEFGDKVQFIEGNAAGDSATCSNICNGFVSDNVDLILANATASLQAASAATTTIPVLGTAITEYGVALNIDDFSGTVGTNISGTSDLAPLDQQAEMFKELLPNVTKVGIIYCSGEANSLYQVKVVKDALEKMGITVSTYSFSNSNDISLVTSQAVDECEALYIPTDNSAASCAEIIGSICLDKNTPVICGEEGTCKACGIATLTIDYYQLGVLTGQMAVKILKGEADVKDMAIEYYPNPVKKYNADICSRLGIEIGSDYIAIED